MKVLFLPNWNLEEEAARLQRPIPERYYIASELPQLEMDVIDTSSIKFIEKFEKYKFHFYVIQAIKAFFRLRHKQYDLLFCDGMQSAIVLSLLYRFFKKKTKIVVLDIGCFNSGATSGFAMKLMQFASKSLDCLIFYASVQKDYYKKYYPWLYDKAFFVPLGTRFRNLNQYKPFLPKDEDQRYILVVGGESMTDIQTLEKAYSLVKTDIPIKIIGMKGDFSHVKDRRMEFLPRVTFPELENLIEKSMFCIHPLLFSKFSYGQLRLLQEMIQYKAVIASKVPSLIDYAIDGEHVLFYPAKDHNALAAKITSLIYDENLRKKLGENAHCHAIKNNSFKAMADRMYEIFEKLV